MRVGDWTKLHGHSASYALFWCIAVAPLYTFLFVLLHGVYPRAN